MESGHAASFQTCVCTQSAFINRCNRRQSSLRQSKHIGPKVIWLRLVKKGDEPIIEAIETEAPVSTPVSRKALREAILESFDYPSLQILLSDMSPSRHLDALVSKTASFKYQVFELIALAFQEGWIGSFLEAALYARQDKPAFVRRVQPIADAVKAGIALTPDETPPKRISTTSTPLSFLQMDASTARVVIVAASLVLTGLLLLFFMAAPFLGAPFNENQNENVRLIEIVLPVFLGYLGSASHFLFYRNRGREVAEDQQSLLGLMVFGSLSLFALFIVALLAIFWVSNLSDSQGAMDFDSLSRWFSLAMGLLACTIGIVSAYLFGSPQGNQGP
ncbi:MAG: effector-associated domain EAD1-containing protein [Candidatus Binatia bacterium]